MGCLHLELALCLYNPYSATPRSSNAPEFGSELSTPGAIVELGGTQKQAARSACACGCQTVIRPEHPPAECSHPLGSTHTARRTLQPHSLAPASGVTAAQPATTSSTRCADRSACMLRTLIRRCSTLIQFCDETPSAYACNTQQAAWSKAQLGPPQVLLRITVIDTFGIESRSCGRLSCMLLHLHSRFVTRSPGRQRLISCPRSGHTAGHCHGGQGTLLRGWQLEVQ